MTLWLAPHRPQAAQRARSFGLLFSIALCAALSAVVVDSVQAGPGLSAEQVRRWMQLRIHAGELQHEYRRNADQYQDCLLYTSPSPRDS